MYLYIDKLSILTLKILMLELLNFAISLDVGFKISMSSSISIRDQCNSVVSIPEPPGLQPDYIFQF